VADVMTPRPVAIHENTSLREAHERMHRLRLKALVVVDDHNRVTGVIEVYDSPYSEVPEPVTRSGIAPPRASGNR
jgi:CBS-domain-containing membrane protein